MDTTTPRLRVCIATSLTFALGALTAPGYAQQDVPLPVLMSHMLGVRKLANVENTAIVQACEKIQLEKGEIITEDDELATAMAALQKHAKRYRTIRMREAQLLQAAQAKAGPGKKIYGVSYKSIVGLPQRIHDRIEAKYAAAGSNERDKLLGQVAAMIRLAYLERSISEEILVAKSLGTVRNAGSTTMQARRMSELAKEIATYDPGHFPLVEITDRTLSQFVVGELQANALRQYKHLAVAALMVDPRTGRPVSGNTRILIGGNAMRSLVTFLDKRGKSSDLDTLLRVLGKPGKHSLDLAREMEAEVADWIDYRLATFLHTGIEPSVDHYFLAVARVIRFEQDRVQTWLREEYVGGEWQKVGLGKLMRASNAWGTGDSGIDAVQRRMARFDLESSAIIAALRRAAESASPKGLTDPQLALLESFGYVVRSATGEQTFQIPKNPSRVNKRIRGNQARLDQPGASWLDVITPESVGIMIASVIVPELLAVEAEAMAATMLTSRRGIMAVRVLADIGADIVVTGSIEALAMDEKDRASLDQLVLESAVLGGVLNAVGSMPGKLTRGLLDKVARSEKETLLYRLVKNAKFRKPAEKFVIGQLELANEAALTLMYQTVANGQEIDSDAIFSTLLQSAMSRRIAKTWDRAPNRLPQTAAERKQFVIDNSPDWLRVRLQDNDPLAKEFSSGVVRHLEPIIETRRRLESTLAKGSGPDARRVFLGLIRGELTRRDLNRLYASYPVQYRDLATEVSSMISTYAYTMRREAYENAREDLWSVTMKRRDEIIAAAGSADAASAELAALWNRLGHELQLLAKEPVAPGSDGAASDVDRSAESVWLRRHFKRTYEMRAKWYVDGEVVTSARALDVNEYINVMPFIKECRQYSKRMDPLKPHADEQLPSNHQDAKEALSIAMIIKGLSPKEVARYVSGREGRIESTVAADVRIKPAERRSELAERLTRERSLIEAAKKSVAASVEALASWRKKVAAEKPGLGRSELDIHARDRLYDERMVAINDLQYKLAEIEIKHGAESQLALELRARILRDMSIAMRDGIETYSQPIGIDIIVNAVQSTMIRRPDGTERKMKTRDRLDDANFTIDDGVNDYTKTDMKCMLNDQYKFIMEHVHGYLSGHETPYETGRALGKYIERTFLARKAMGKDGGLDIAEVRRRPIYDTTKRLLRITQELVLNKDNPDGLRKALSDFSRRSPGTPRQGLLELLLVMDKSLPDLRGLIDNADLGEARGPDAEAIEGNPIYHRARTFVISRRKTVKYVLQEIAGSTRLLEHLNTESAAIDTELRAIEQRIDQIERLSAGFLAADWEQIAVLEKRLDGIRLVRVYLPADDRSSLFGSLRSSQAKLEAEIAAAHQRFVNRPGNRELRLYEQFPEYAWLVDRKQFLLTLRSLLDEEIPAAAKSGEYEAAAAKADITGDWLLVRAPHDGQPEERIMGRLRLEREGADVSLHTVWSDMPAFVVRGRYRHGRILGVWGLDAKAPNNGEEQNEEQVAERAILARGLVAAGQGLWEARLMIEDGNLLVSERTTPRFYEQPDEWRHLRLVRDDTAEFATVVTHWENGNKASEYRVRRPRSPSRGWDLHRTGVRHGPYSCWVESGELENSGIFVNGIPDGAWVHYGISRGGPNGSVVTYKHEGSYAAGLRHGLWILRNTDGSIRGQTEYRFGLRHGAEVFRADGTTVTYRDLILHGELIRGSQDFLPPSGHYRMGLRDGDVSLEAWGETTVGSLRYGVRHGEWTVQSRDGTVTSMANFADGLLDGPRTQWWPTGKKRIEGRSVAGTRSGIWTEWREDGTLARVDEHSEPLDFRGAKLLQPSVLRERVRTAVSRLDRISGMGIVRQELKALVLRAKAFAAQPKASDLEFSRRFVPAQRRFGTFLQGTSQDEWRVTGADGAPRFEARFSGGRFERATVHQPEGKRVLSIDSRQRLIKWASYRADGTRDYEAWFDTFGVLRGYKEWYTGSENLHYEMHSISLRDKWSVHRADGEFDYGFSHKQGAVIRYNATFRANGEAYSVSVTSGDGHLGALRKGSVKHEASGDTFALGLDSDTPFNGVHKRFDMDGQIEVESSYARGKLHGLQTVYHYNNKKLGSQRSTLFEMGTSTNSGVRIVWSNVGDKRQKLSEQHFLNDELHGLVARYHSNGVKSLQTNYIKGKVSGDRSTWYQNGKPESVSSFDVEGRHHGLARSWHESGLIEKERSYHHGKPHGTWTFYRYEDGKLRSKEIVVYEDGQSVSSRTVEIGC